MSDQQDEQREVATEPAGMESVLAFGVWFILSCLGGIALIIAYLYLWGFIGLIPAVSAIFAAFVGFFPTYSSANGRSRLFCLLNLLLVVASGVTTAFTVSVAAQMAQERYGAIQIAESNKGRAKTIEEAAINARKNNLNSKGAAAVSGQVKELMVKEADTERYSLITDEGDSEWMRQFKKKDIRFVEWWNGLATFLLTAILAIVFRGSESKDGDWIPDFFQKRRKKSASPNA